MRPKPSKVFPSSSRSIRADDAAEGLVAGTRNTRLLRLVEWEIPKVAAQSVASRTDVTFGFSAARTLFAT
jgi:hypothetical protein